MDTDQGAPVVQAEFAEAGARIGRIVEEKNRAYGNSFVRSAEILRMLYPTGVLPEQYGDMLGIVRVLDKLSRIATDRDQFGESPWGDIAGYGILGEVRVIHERLAAAPTASAVPGRAEAEAVLHREIERLEAAGRLTPSDRIACGARPLTGLGPNDPSPTGRDQFGKIVEGDDGRA